MAVDPQLQDRALSGFEGDLLDRGPFVESLVRALVTEINGKKGARTYTATSHVVGLTGAWGLGKSSTLAMTAERLKALPGVVPVLFNPWLFSGRDELLEGFFGELRNALGSSVHEHARGVRDQLDKYWNAIRFVSKIGAHIVDAQGAAGAASVAVEALADLRPGQSERRSALEEKRALEKKISSSKLAVVVLIDELDRVEDHEVRAVAQLVKAIGEINGISYLVAYEPERVADALGRGHGAERVDSGERYLEKIIQHPIPLRPLFIEDTEKLLASALAAKPDLLPEPSSEQTKVYSQLKEGIGTPREVKRLIGSFEIIRKAVQDDICPYDVLAYAWMITRSPSLHKSISVNLDKLVDDPSEQELSDRIVADIEKKPQVTVAELLGVNAAPYADLLKLLFPRFGLERHSDAQQGIRLSRRQNLVRILYLGDPPNAFSRKHVEALWATGDATALRHQLHQLIAKEQLTSFIDRLDDFVELLDPKFDGTFWPTLCSVVERDTDWVTEPNINRGIAEDIATVILKLGLRTSDNKTRVRRIFDLLVDAGDASVSAYILRKHLHHYGLTKHNTRQRDDTLVLTLEECKSLIESEIPRYKKAITEGRALKRLPNVEAIYCVANLVLWDAEIRESFGQQLLNEKLAIASWASLCLPPGYSTSKSSLNDLFDTDAVLRRIESLDDPSTWCQDAWVAGCVRRLRAVLEGRDPMFDID